MAEIVNGVFVLFEGVGSTIFASQVSQHVHEMNKKGIRIHVLAFEPNRKNMAQSIKNRDQLKKLFPDLSITLKPCVNLFLPFSMWINWVLLMIEMWRLRGRQQIDFVHARADHCASLCVLQNMLKNQSVIWDCRGDSYAELEAILARKLRGPMKMLKWYFLIRQQLILKMCAKFCTSAVFVSESLRDMYRLSANQQSVIVPCSVSEDLFYVDASLRAKLRAKWNIPEDKHILLYAGGLAAYQGFNRIEACFEKHADSPEIQLVMVTPDIDHAKSLFAQSLNEKMLFKTAQFDEMNAVYNAADIGILLRNPSDINTVASPTKFGEYSLTGLPVISNDTVEQIQQKTREIGNFIPEEADELVPLSVKERILVSRRATQFFGRNINNQIYCELYKNLNASSGSLRE